MVVFEAFVRLARCRCSAEEGRGVRCVRERQRALAVRLHGFLLLARSLPERRLAAVATGTARLRWRHCEGDEHQCQRCRLREVHLLFVHSVPPPLAALRCHHVRAPPRRGVQRRPANRHRPQQRRRVGEAQVVQHGLPGWRAARRFCCGGPKLGLPDVQLGGDGRGQLLVVAAATEHHGEVLRRVPHRSYSGIFPYLANTDARRARSPRPLLSVLALFCHRAARRV
mmetsp:Transcript_37173/g.91126  ORF Transcript_37173/g.91126 Transcript_37173/m.91126 type:complete len:226 (+) Transcript_37173:231-908(+)